MKYRLYPSSIVDFFIESQIENDIESIKVNQNDSINYELRFTKNKLNMIVFDSTRMTFKYCFGKVSKIQNFKNDSINGKTKFVRLFPFTWIFNNGLQYTSVSGFNGIVKHKSLTGLQTFTKTKISYKKGIVSKTKHFDWQTVAQRCYYSGYEEYQYPNDTTVIIKSYDRNDSLALIQTNVFDNKSNILKVSSLKKKRATGWGIDVTYYSYDGNETETHIFDYKFDDRNNWIERIEYVNDTIKNKTIRLIKYKN
ncbi:MAG: hypothetical protein R6U15_04675 [Candidatus Izemoplasmatales bacterium]